MAKNKYYAAPPIWHDRKHWMWFPFSFTRYSLTEKKLILSVGLLQTRESECMLYRILDVSRSQTLLQKLFGTGTVTLITNDRSDPNIVLKNIKHSGYVKELLSDKIEAARIANRVREVTGSMGFEPEVTMGQGIDIDGDGIIDGIDIDGDGIID